MSSFDWIDVPGEWRVAVKHGRGWREYPGTVTARTDLDAARQVRRSWGHYQLVRVIPDFPGSKWRRYRFAKPNANTNT